MAPADSLAWLLDQAPARGNTKNSRFSTHERTTDKYFRSFGLTGLLAVMNTVIPNNGTGTLNPQLTGNASLYYCCYRLSLLEWNVMPTARNALGVDVIAYSADASASWGFRSRP